MASSTSIFKIATTTTTTTTLTYQNRASSGRGSTATWISNNGISDFSSLKIERKVK